MMIALCGCMMQEANGSGQAEEELSVRGSDLRNP